MNGQIDGVHMLVGLVALAFGFCAGFAQGYLTRKSTERGAEDCKGCEGCSGCGDYDMSMGAIV